MSSGDTNLGPFRINPRGELDPNAKYKLLDLISYNGSSYLNINSDIIDGIASQGQLPDIGEPATKYYMLVAARGEKGESSNRYDSFSDLNMTTNDWDYSISDKITITDGSGYNNSKTINIANVYDGCCGAIITKLDIKLPANSEISADFNYVVPLDDEYYIYTFIYDGTRDKFMWNRSVYKNA